MARFSIVGRHRQVLRQILGSNCRTLETLISSTPIPSLSSTVTSKPFSSGSTRLHFSKLPFFQSRPLSSPSGSSNIVLIKSENDFNTSLTKVEDESLPAIFYFTAFWCGPCKFISPLISELSEKYPHVTTHKIDIDQEGLQNVLSKLNITSVPTLHFFQNGKKAAEVIGADVTRLKDTMEKLYKTD